MEDTNIINASKDAYFDSHYFKSYDYHHIHAEMLSDRVRTEAYQKAILDNPQLFDGKVVLDIGCGTGILSMFAAQAGAKHVYSIDYSQIADKAKQIVAANGFEDTITVIRGKMEEVDLPCKVDVIISEWMGYALLYEAMLGSVIYARNRWLAPNGVILPDKATMFLSAIEDADYKKSKIDFWDDVYGFDMSLMKEQAMCEALVDVVEPTQTCTDYAKLCEIDIMTISRKDLDFITAYALTLKRSDYVYAFVLHFEIAFGLGHKPVSFSTAADAEYTHWKQSVFYLDQILTLSKGAVIQGHFAVKANEANERGLDFTISYSAAKAYPNTKPAASATTRSKTLANANAKKKDKAHQPVENYTGSNVYFMR